MLTMYLVEQCTVGYPLPKTGCLDHQEDFRVKEIKIDQGYLSGSKKKGNKRFGFLTWPSSVMLGQNYRTHQ